MKLAAIGLALLLTSCATLKEIAHGYPKPDGYEKAVNIVWHDVYGRTEPAPSVIWVPQEHLDCDDGKGFKAVTMQNRCVAGITYVSRAVTVALPAGRRLSDTALAHELCHAYLLFNGTGDPTHSGPEWQPGGAVEKARSALAAAGF